VAALRDRTAFEAEERERLAAYAAKSADEEVVLAIPTPTSNQPPSGGIKTGSSGVMLMSI